MRASFQVNLYDKDGDKFEDGIFLHLVRDLGDKFPLILKFKEVDEIDELVKHLTAISKEYKESHS